MLAIITARGGSKRIPGKNIRDFCGKPIIAYTIEAALRSGVFDEVMVSTDDEKIAAVAKEYGAEVPFFRSAGTADDHATTAEVAAEVVNEYKKRGREIDSICLLYPTAPFISAERLREACEAYAASGADALIPVVSFSYPPQRAFVMSEDGDRLVYRWPENEKKRSQDLQKFYHDAGQFYFVRADIPGSQGTVVPKDTAPFILDEMEVQDIDNETDWKLAELKWRLLNEK